MNGEPEPRGTGPTATSTYKEAAPEIEQVLQQRLRQLGFEGADESVIADLKNNALFPIATACTIADQLGSRAPIARLERTDGKPELMTPEAVHCVVEGIVHRNDGTPPPSLEVEERSGAHRTVDFNELKLNFAAAMQHDVVILLMGKLGIQPGQSTRAPG